jgi:hypothetical protein
LFSNKQIFTSGLGCVVSSRKHAQPCSSCPLTFSPPVEHKTPVGKRKNRKNYFLLPEYVVVLKDHARPPKPSVSEVAPMPTDFFRAKSRTPDLASSRKRATCSSCPLPSHLFPSGGAQNRREKRPHFDPQKPQRLLSLPR